MRIRRIFLGGILCVLCGMTTAFATGIDPAAEGWLWRVIVLPPSGGWESPQGISAIAAFSLVEKEVADRHHGVRGHDLEFVGIAPVAAEDVPDEIPSHVAEWRASHVVAILSFGGEEVDRALVSTLGDAGLPLLLAGGENVRLRDGDGSPVPFAFAVDLYRRFRVRALADEAARLLEKGLGVAVFSDRLDPFLADSSSLFQAYLFEKGLVPLPVWVSGPADRNVGSRMKEVLSSGASLFVCFVGLTGALDIWRQVRENQIPVEIWTSEPSDPLLAPRQKIVTVDQHRPFERDRALGALRTAIWDVSRVQVPDRATAGRAYALGEWLVQALDRVPGEDGVGLAAALAGGKGIPFGSERLDIDPATHRPREREVVVLQSDGRDWVVRSILRVRSGGFPE